MDVPMNKSWKDQLEGEFQKSYFQSLSQFIQIEYEKRTASTFPAYSHIFRAFDECLFDDVKVVILGQDPYPTKGFANGLSFSVGKDVSPLPKSLVNIYKELASDLHIEVRTSGDLSHWATQGVLMLNSVLTVSEGLPESHAGKGWEQFTDAVIANLNNKKSKIVYLLWGKKAHDKANNVDESQNLVLKSVHPSPLSAYRGFFGCQHFSKANAYLKSQGKKPVIW